MSSRNEILEKPNQYKSIINYTIIGVVFFDNLNSLAYRVWRYHSFGYKIKKRSINRFFNLSIEQIKFFVKRSMSDILKLKFNLLYLNFMVMIKFINLEFKNIDKKI